MTLMENKRGNYHKYTNYYTLLDKLQWFEVNFNIVGFIQFTTYTDQITSYLT